MKFRRLCLIISAMCVVMLNIPYVGANSLDTQSQKKNVDSMIQSIGKQRREDSQKLKDAMNDEDEVPGA